MKAGPVVAVVALASTVAACGSGQDAEIEDAAASFYGALADRDGDAACALLAPATRTELEQSAGRPCPQAVLEEQLPEPAGSGEVAAFATNGQVRYDGETAFLTRFPDGWKVVAAGCRPRGARPYDCTVTGG